MLIDIDGIELEYTVNGPEKGRPVLVLHGWGCDCNTMHLVINALALNRRVVALSFPGHGKSSHITNVWGIEDYTNLTLKFMDRLGIEKADMVAHSFGGRVAICIASDSPERAGKLVMTGAAGIKPRRSIKYYFKVYTYKIMKWFCKLLGLDAEKLASKSGSEDYRKLSPAERATFSRVVNRDLTDKLGSIKAPTLLIWGDADTETPLYMAKIMEKKIPDCGLVLLKGSHFAFAERAAEFNKITEYFLGEE